VAIFCGFFASAQVTITDADLVAGETYNWTSDNVYILDGLVYLEEGGVLNIEAGTVIKGAATITTGDNTSALIIARGAQIFANGTASDPSDPIIFTAEEDDLTDNGDFTAQDRGEWGGLIVLGKATIARPDGADGIEGIDADEARAQFGGTEDDDNSGVIKYISIRHGGAQLSPNNEINGLTLGGVGSGTEIDYVEVFANLDDGIEFFGGTVRRASSGSPSRAPLPVPVVPASTMVLSPTSSLLSLTPPSTTQPTLVSVKTQHPREETPPRLSPSPCSSATTQVVAITTPSSPTSMAMRSPLRTATTPPTVTPLPALPLAIFL